MTPDVMIARARRQANMPAAQGRAGDPEIMDYLNDAKDILASAIIDADQKYFEQNENVTFVANQEEYDIPSIFRDDKISLVQRLKTDGTVLRDVGNVRFQDKERYVEAEVSIDDAGSVYWLRNRKIGFAPKPPSAMTDAVKVYGVQFPQDMYWGGFLGTGLTTTAFVLAESGNELKAGRPSMITDYYKNAYVMVLTGTAGRGINRKISAYNSTTRTVTIDTAWTVSDVVGQQFAIISQVPEQYHQAMIHYAVAQLSAKTPDSDRYQSAMKSFTDLMGVLVASIESRNIDENRHILLPTDWDE